MIDSRPGHLALLVVLGIMAPVCTAADDFRVSQLEQDVRDLQRQVQALSRELEAQRGAVPPTARREPPRTPQAAATPVTALPMWVDAVRWQRLKTGMNELEVLALLGPPTSMRMEQGTRVLLYAMEIGKSGYLGGSVRLRDRSVVAVLPPSLQ
ncbi:MAG: hypothetical protein U1F39_03235 [Steroidobacteraceae bacterium]